MVDNEIDKKKDTSEVTKKTNKENSDEVKTEANKENRDGAKTEIIKETTKSIATKKNEPNLDQYGRIYATGKRKSSIARVWMKLGSGKITINGLLCEEYFKRETHRLIISQPLQTTSRLQTYDINCSVKGGGHSGQAGALRHGVSKALTEFEPELRSVLKSAGFIKRDARRVERKKYGQPKARRSFQFSKR